MSAPCSGSGEGETATKFTPSSQRPPDSRREFRMAKEQKQRAPPAAGISSTHVGDTSVTVSSSSGEAATRVGEDGVDSIDPRLPDKRRTEGRGPRKGGQRARRARTGRGGRRARRDRDMEEEDEGCGGPGPGTEGRRARVLGGGAWARTLAGGGQRRRRGVELEPCS